MLRLVLAIPLIAAACEQSPPAPTPVSTPSPSSSNAKPCRTSGTRPAAPAGPVAPVSAELALATTPSYRGEIQAMVQTYCSSCHSGKKSPSLTSYAEVQAAANDALSTMQSGDMPRGGSMPQDQVALFQAWVTAGTPDAPKAAPSPVQPPPPPGPAPSNNKTQLIPPASKQQPGKQTQPPASGTTTDC